MSKEIGIEVGNISKYMLFTWGMLSSLVVSAACSGYYSFNNLLYKEWVTNDDKDCSIIPIKLRRYIYIKKKKKL